MSASERTLPLHDHVAAPARTPQLHVLGTPRLLAGAHSGPVDYAGHADLPGVLPHWRLDTLIAATRAVGLLGRGGAAFPVAVKLAALRPGRHNRVLVNGSESEPASWKDRVLMQHAPHRVIDGAILVSGALGTRRTTIAVHDPEPARVLRAALRERSDARRIRVVQTRGGFVGGEVQALINGLSGSAAVPNGRRTLPVDRGLDARPTFASNVETFAQLGLLGRLGPDGFRGAGSAQEPGTVLVTLVGDVPRAGVAEVPTGTPLRALVGATSSPVLLGGYHGTWVTDLDLYLDRPELRARGIGLGAGVVAALPHDTCPIGEVARVARWLSQESAGQCGPCIFGLAAIAEDLERLAAARPVDLRALRARLGLVEGRGACSHPDGASRFVATALEAFADDVERHAAGQHCGHPVRKALPLPHRGTP